MSTAITARAPIIHYLIRAALLAGFALLIVYLKQTGSLTLFVSPRTEQGVKLSALGLYAAAAYQAFSAFRLWRDGKHAVSCDCEGHDHAHGHDHGHHHGHGHDHDHNHGHSHAPSPSVLRNLAVYSLFALPLILGFVVPHEPMSSALAAKKGMNYAGQQSAKQLIAKEQTTNQQIDQQTANRQSAQETAKEQQKTADQSQIANQLQTDIQQIPAKQQQASLDTLFPADEYTTAYASFGKKLYKQNSIVVKDDLFIETLTALDLYQSNFVGKKVTLSGFVYRDQNMKPDQFAVSRFVMNCCSADALPYGLMIHSPDAGKYNTDDWLSVTGVVKTTKFNGNTIIMLETEKINPIKAPADPYAYPNYTFDTESF